MALFIEMRGNPMKKVTMVVENPKGVEFEMQFLTDDEEPVDAVFDEYDLFGVKVKDCKVETLEVRAIEISSYRISPKS